MIPLLWIFGATSTVTAALFATGTGTGLGEPWDSLIKLGITPVVFIALLGTRRIRWSGEVTDLIALKDEQIAELRKERDEARNESKEVRTWLQTVGWPLFSQATEMVKASLASRPQ